MPPSPHHITTPLLPVATTIVTHFYHFLFLSVIAITTPGLIVAVLFFSAVANCHCVTAPIMLLMLLPPLHHNVIAIAPALLCHCLLSPTTATSGLLPLLALPVCYTVPVENAIALFPLPWPLLVANMFWTAVTTG